MGLQKQTVESLEESGVSENPWIGEILPDFPDLIKNAHRLNGSQNPGTDQFRRKQAADQAGAAGKAGQDQGVNADEAIGGSLEDGKEKPEGQIENTAGEDRDGNRQTGCDSEKLG